VKKKTKYKKKSTILCAAQGKNKTMFFEKKTEKKVEGTTN
jgi:hypothetical protein